MNLENEGTEELKQSTFCDLTQAPEAITTSDATQFMTWVEVVNATQQSMLGSVSQDPLAPSTSYRDAELQVLRTCQADSFPDEVKALRKGKQVSCNSRLSCLSPEWDLATELIRVGGCFRRMEEPHPVDIYPIVLEPHHKWVKLLIREVDNRLLHPGPDQVFAELRRQYCVLRGRQVVKHIQRTCTACKKWRGKPTVPLMADLPAARLRLFKPPFYSTGVDCFGPYLVKVGCRNEKRWGLIFKCLTTRCVYLDLINSLDTDAFLLALRRFIARRGTPSEIYSDQGTNFRGAEGELKDAFADVEPQLQKSSASHQIIFRFNPPASPHFGGIWEIRSVKRALQVVLGAQAVPEDVLLTVLIEVEGILNAKPLGYVSSDVL